MWDGAQTKLDFWFLVQHVRDLGQEKNLSDLKINNFCYIHQRNKIIGQTTVPKIKDRGR